MSDKVKAEANTQVKNPGQLASEVLSEISNDMFEQTGGDRYTRAMPSDPATQHSEPSEGEKPPKEQENPKEEKASEVEDVLAQAKEALDKMNASEAKNSTLAKKITELEAMLVALSPSEKSDDPYELLEKESYVPKELLEKAVALGVEKKLQEMMQPEIARKAADAEIIKLYPEYAKDYQEMLAFLDKNPTVARDVQYATEKGEHLLARKFAYTLFRSAKTAYQKSENNGKAAEREEKVKEAKADAGVLKTPRQPKSEQPAPKWPSRERMEQLKESAKRGHPEQLYRETIGVLLEEQGFPV